MRRLRAVQALVIALLAAPTLAAQRTEPDLRSCTPRDFEQQSGIPMAALYVDGGEGGALGRGGSGTPFVASLQGNLLWSMSAASRRWALGPLAGVSYANPKVHGMLGARLRYRLLPIRIHDQMDLGLGVDLFADGLWETPSAALVGLGVSADLPLDAVIPINGPRIFGRVLRDTERDDWRLEIGLGVRPWRRRVTVQPTPREPERWRFAIGSIQTAIQAGVERTVIVAGPPPDTLLLCDYALLRKATSVLDQLHRDAGRPASTVSADTLEGRFSEAGLSSLVAQLKSPANSWRRHLADSRAAQPPVTEAAAIVIVSERVRAILLREFKLGGSP